MRPGGRGKRYGCIRWLTPLVYAGVLGISLPSFAQSTASPDELARRHFESGAAYLQESDYDNALKAFEKAYELSRRPEILLNIATVHERRGDLQAAVARLRDYLEATADGGQVETVKLRIANLEKRLASQPKDEPAAPSAAQAEKPVSTPASTPSEPLPQSAPPPPTAEAQPNRVPAYVLLGLGGLAAGAAVLTGVIAKSEYDDAEETCSPGCTDDDVSSGRTMAMTSTVFSGIAVGALAVGTVLFFTGDSKPAASASTGFRRLQLGVASGSATANASWRF